MHDLLFHLERKNFGGTPRFLGVDDQNREILSFLPGEVARQTALAVAGREQGKIEMADWAASAASWTILNVAERLSPTGYHLRPHS